MNLNLITFLIVSGLTLHVFADRNGDRGGRWGGGQSDSTSPRTESATPARSAPAPTARYVAPQATERTFTPSQAPAERSYTPSQPYQGERVKSRGESFQSQETQRQPQQRVTVTPRQEQPDVPSVSRTQPVVQPTQPITMPQQPTTTPRNTFQDSRGESERASSHTHRDRQAPATAQTQPVVQPTQPITMPQQPTTTPGNTFQGVRREPERTSSHTPSTREHRDRQAPATAQTQPVVQPTQPETTPHVKAPSRELSTQHHEQPRNVQITSPRTDRRITEKEHSPFIFEGRTPEKTEHAEIATRMPLSQAQHQAVSLRSPQQADSRTREPEHYREAYAQHPSADYRHTSEHYPTYNNTYYSHHYPSHTDHYYRPVTYYNRNLSFWQAFGFTLGASFFAPVYVAPVLYPPSSYVTTTWYGGPVTVSVSARPHYPIYTYRPFYCHTGYIHDGWHYSSAYYGGWRGHWYGGFSYIFNPFPVYRSYYLYEEPQTIVIEQPAPQVVYVNPPAQQTATTPETTAAPAPLTTQPQPAVDTVATDQTATASENTRCFCACKCNGRVPCICEYACGSEFAYSPDEYTLKGFASYSESLNKELIWSSYAGLDRAEPEALVAGATEQ